MTERFRVTRFDDVGIWDGNDAQFVEAVADQDAAELVLGRPLISSGVPGRLRVQVQRPAKPAEKLMFYEPPA